MNGNKTFVAEAESAERAILSTIIFKYDLVKELIHIDALDPDIFFTLEARRIFQAIRLSPCKKNQYDLIDIFGKLKTICASDREFEKCSKYLDGFSQWRVYYFATTSYLELLQAYKVKRNLDQLAQNIKDCPVVVEDFHDQVASWKMKFDDILRKHQLLIKSIEAEMAINDWKAMAKRAKETGGHHFLKTGYRAVDKYLKMLGGGQFIVLASRPGVGKTTFALNVIKNNFPHMKKSLNEESKAIGMFSLEMPTSALMSKLISIDSGVNLESTNRLLEGEIITSEEMREIERSQKNISQLNLLFCDDMSVTVGTIIAHVKSWIYKHNLKLVIIDYLQLISSPNDKTMDTYQQYQKIGMISRNLKILAMEMDVCIFALAQLNRKVEERRGPEKSPILSDLRESGSIEQDADVVMFLYEATAEESEEQALLDQEEEVPQKKVTVLKIAKNRNGPTGSVEFDFNKHKGTYISSL